MKMMSGSRNARWECGKLNEGLGERMCNWRKERDFRSWTETRRMVVGLKDRDDDAEQCL